MEQKLKTLHSIEYSAHKEHLVMTLGDQQLVVLEEMRDIETAKASNQHNILKFMVCKHLVVHLSQLMMEV